MMIFILGISACALTFAYCLRHDDPKRLAQQGKCCNDSFCEGDCGGWGA